ncbi:MAG: TIGR03086 family protein [Geodermatophilaceae bacterium]|nr:TIGR03086 family protein [Geodermatophilaceae bacterium]
MTETDLVRGHARVVRASVAVVSQLRSDDLDRPTPCGNWRLADLLAHMTVQHDGFAAAAAGNGGDPALWAVHPLGDDPVASYTAAAERVVSAFAQPGVLEREFALPEISPITTFSGTLAIGFHFIDYVVHGWDVARAVDVPFSLDADLEEIALRIAMSVPDGPGRAQPDGAFGPGKPVVDAAPVLDRIVAHLGRSPTWSG